MENFSRKTAFGEKNLCGYCCAIRRKVFQYISLKLLNRACQLRPLS